MEFLQLLLLLFCTDISEQKKRKTQAVIADTCFSLLLVPKNKQLPVLLHLCPWNWIQQRCVFFLCCRTGRAAALVRAQRLPTSRPPPSLMKPWLSSSPTHSWTSRSPQSTTDPTSPAPPAGTGLMLMPTFLHCMKSHWQLHGIKKIGLRRNLRSLALVVLFHKLNFFGFCCIKAKCWSYRIEIWGFFSIFQQFRHDNNN